MTQARSGRRQLFEAEQSHNGAELTSFASHTTDGVGARQPGAALRRPLPTDLVVGGYGDSPTAPGRSVPCPRHHRG